MINDWKKYIFENEHETLYETDDFSEMRNYIGNFVNELTLSDMYETINYIIFNFYDYYLMIKK